ncbi:AtpZ/AtpI family protein [candidate division KSB1 bacterium]|nr:AtpZ/AtpI family protein [candidate division KSB1 bacterium]
MTSQKSGIGAAGHYMDLGLRFALAILLTAGGGYWLDSKLHTLPLFLILGLLIGATSGFMTIYRAVYPDREKESGKGE